MQFRINKGLSLSALALGMGFLSMGLAEVASDAPAAVQDAQEVATDNLATHQPRSDSLDVSLDELVASIEKVPVLPPELIDSETLWLARCIYSETKRPEEQELVAWVVRNRVETGYRGKGSYRSVVLDPYQFSAFNPNSRKRYHYMNLTPESQARGWREALKIAHHVRFSKVAQRPFSAKTRHFYSERSMRGRRHPGWAKGKRPVQPERSYNISAQRFRFFSGIA